jgi:hypothetical protein
MGMAISVFMAAVLLSPFKCSGRVDTAIGYAVTFLVCLFVINFAYGWGATAWVVTSEIFPLRIRGASPLLLSFLLFILNAELLRYYYLVLSVDKAVSVTTSANWISNFFIAMFTPSLLDCNVLGVRGTFFLMGVLLSLSFIFVLFTTPETKGKSLEHIDELFTGRSWSEISQWKHYLKCGCPWRLPRFRRYGLVEQEPLVDNVFGVRDSDSTDMSSSDAFVDSSKL